MRRRGLASCAAGLGAVFLSVPYVEAASPEQQRTPAATATEQALVDQYCLRCHNDRALSDGLSFEGLAIDAVADHVNVWGRAVREFRADAMPPTGAPRPDTADSSGLLAYLEAELDTIAPATIISNLARRAYRRPVSDQDLEIPLAFYEQGRAEGDFESGIDLALHPVFRR